MSVVGFLWEEPVVGFLWEERGRNKNTRKV